jgi:hypothetical protein
MRPPISFLVVFPSLITALVLLAGVGASWIAPAAAAPLAHKGSIVVSGEYDPAWSSFTATPAITRSTGVGPALHWMQPESGSGGTGNGDSAGQELWSLVSITQRLHRWNGAQYQANAWAGVGAGLLTIFPDDGSSRANRAAWSPWGQLDFETRRLYVGGSARWFQAADIGRLMTSARAGVALTPASYDHWQPWLMVEARTMEGLVQGVEITPLLRVIHRRVLAEAGVSTTGSVRLNLTYTY